MSKAKKSKGAALVTGGSKRIGAAISLHLASIGYDIALTYNTSLKEAELIRRQIIKLGRRAEIIHHDFTFQNETKKLIQQVRKIFPQLNVLINNASIFDPSSLKNCSVESLRENMGIHVETPLILSQEYNKICKKGNIINLLDTHISSSKSAHAAYLLSKKTLSNMTAMLSVEFAPQIRVNGICPGLIIPPKDKPKNYLQRLSKRVPLKKIGQVEHITKTVEFLINNTYITGDVIFVDGGEHLVY